MKRGLLAFLIFASTIIQSHAQGQIYHLTLEECVEFAVDNHVSVRNAVLERESAKFRIKELTSTGFPQVDANFSVNNNFKIPTTFIPALFFDPTAGPDDFAPVQFSQQYSGNTGVTASQMIFDGSFFTGLKAAKALNNVREAEYEQTQADVAHTVTLAFYELLINKERLRFLQENVQRLDTLLHETTVLNENGFVEKIDVDRIRVNYNNAQTASKRMLRGLALNYVFLKFQMGMDINSKLDIVGDIRDIDSELNSPEAPQVYIKNRSDYQVLQGNLSLLEQQVKNTRVRRLPSIYANANYGWNTSTNKTSQLFDFDNNWFALGAVGATVRFPVFDSFVKKNQIQQQKIQVYQMQNTINNLEYAIDVEVTQYHAQLLNSQDELDLQNQNYDLSKEIYRIANIKYQEGVGSNLELIDASTSLQVSESNYYNALYEAIAAKTNLLNAQGILYFSK